MLNLRSRALSRRRVSLFAFRLDEGANAIKGDSHPSLGDSHLTSELQKDPPHEFGAADSFRERVGVQTRFQDGIHTHRDLWIALTRHLQTDPEA